MDQLEDGALPFYLIIEIYLKGILVNICQTAVLTNTALYGLHLHCRFQFSHLVFISGVTTTCVEAALASSEPQEEGGPFGDFK